MKAIGTVYNGYRFRSRLEARWAVFFDALGVEYEYEPEGMILSNGDYYLPDFYLPNFYSYFEVKHAPQKIIRSGLPYTEFKDAITKIKDGSFTDSWSGIIAFGDPFDHYMWIFCQAADDSGGGSYDNSVVFGINPEDGKPILYAWNDYRDRAFFDTWKSSNIIPMVTTADYRGTWYGDNYENPFLNERVVRAELKARQARFEHGESPTFL